MDKKHKAGPRNGGRRPKKVCRRRLDTACLPCRRAKVRCIGQPSGVCNRCKGRGLGHMCVREPRKKPGPKPKKKPTPTGSLSGSSHTLSENLTFTPESATCSSKGHPDSLSSAEHGVIISTSSVSPLMESRSLLAPSQVDTYLSSSSVSSAGGSLAWPPAVRFVNAAWTTAPGPPVSQPEAPQRRHSSASLSSSHATHATFHVPTALPTQTPGRTSAIGFLSSLLSLVSEWYMATPQLSAAQTWRRASFAMHMLSRCKAKHPNSAAVSSFANLVTSQCQMLVAEVPLEDALNTQLHMAQPPLMSTSSLLVWERSPLGVLVMSAVPFPLAGCGTPWINRSLATSLSSLGDRSAVANILNSAELLWDVLDEYSFFLFLRLLWTCLDNRDPTFDFLLAFKARNSSPKLVLSTTWLLKYSDLGVLETMTMYCKDSVKRSSARGGVSTSPTSSMFNQSLLDTAASGSLSTSQASTSQALAFLVENSSAATFSSQIHPVQSATLLSSSAPSSSSQSDPAISSDHWLTM